MACSYFLMMSNVPSVEPPSMMIYSTLSYVSLMTLRMVSSRNFSLLKTTVTMVINGFSSGEELGVKCSLHAGLWVKGLIPRL